MLSRASGITTIGHGMLKKMKKHFGGFLGDIGEVVYNGYDEDDFQGVCERENDGFIYIRYVGTIFGNRNVQYFIEALGRLKSEGTLPDNIRVEFIGNYFIETIEILSAESLSSIIKVIPQQSHSQAVVKMRTADLLLLFVSTADGEDFIPGKVFEYIRATVPIFAMVPVGGEVAKILSSLGHKYICQMEDTLGIMVHLRDFFATMGREQKLRYDPIYSRERQVEGFIRNFQRKNI
jgi:glycosyltransferase involved in cell wall biosynthesis